MSRVLNLRDFRHPRERGGFNLPPDVVRIDRGSKWGNHYRIGDAADPEDGFLDASKRMTREDVLWAYRGWLAHELAVNPTFLDPLRGKRLACWCAPLPCHGDIIVEFIRSRSLHHAEVPS